MRLKKLKLNNIRSYEELEIEFPQGSVLLSGDIGSGKTSILLGLQFALFGLQPGQKGSSILRNGKDTAEVYLNLEIDNKDISVSRKIKKSKNGSITQEEGCIEIDGEKMEISTSELRSKIISLLGYPKEFTKKSDLLYKFTVYTPQEGMKEIIQEKSDVRLDLLRHIFGIEKYKRIKENSSIFIQNLKDSIKIKDALCLEISPLREKIALEKERKIKKTKENNDLSIEISKLRIEKYELEKSIKNIEKEIQEKHKLEIEISKKEIELTGKIAMKSKIEREISALKSQNDLNQSFNPQEIVAVNNLLEKHRNYKEELQQKFIKINSRISVLNSEREKTNLRKDQVDSLENCPTCLQSVGCEHKEKITKKAIYEIEEIDLELQPLLVEKKQIILDMEKEKQLLAGYESDKFRLEKEKIKFENAKSIEIKVKSELFLLERIVLEIQNIEKEITDIKQKLKSFTTISESYESENIKIKKTDEILKKSEIVFAENKREIDLLIERIESDEKELDEKEKIKKQAAYLREILDWINVKFLNLISLTERNVLTKIRQDFSKLFSEWFSMLVTDSLNVELDEDFTPVIYNQDYQIEYDFLSGGERTAVALAYRLALNQMINSVFSEIKTKDLIILDEPTDGFSEQQLDKIRDIFDQMQSKQMILVSHEQKIEGFVDNIIRVKKEDSSKIQETRN